METAIYFKNHHYRLLWKVLTKTRPELATEIINEYIPEETPKETDLSKIGYYFTAFSNVEYTESKVDVRRYFVAAMIHLYCPQVLRQPLDSIILKYGFVKALSGVLDQKDANISNMIRQVITWEKNYEDFEKKVSELVIKMGGG